MKSIVYLFLVPMLFLGSVGLDVFKHICEDDGVSVSYVFNTIDHCDDHQEELPLCCEEEKEDDCCDDEVEHIQMSLDFFQNQNTFHNVVQLEMGSTPIYFFESTLSKSLTQAYSNTDPPPRRQSQRLAIIQSYLI